MYEHYRKFAVLVELKSVLKRRIGSNEGVIPREVVVVLFEKALESCGMDGSVDVGQLTLVPERSLGPINH